MKVFASIARLTTELTIIDEIVALVCWLNQKNCHIKILAVDLARLVLCGLINLRFVQPQSNVSSINCDWPGRRNHVGL